MCFGSVKGAYKSLPLAPLSTADHNCVHLIPVYHSALRRGEVLTKRIQNWTEDSSLTLQGCLDCMDWKVFVDSSRDIDELLLKADLSNSSPVTGFDECTVANTFKHCKRKTSPGPDNIGSHLLFRCAEQLGPIFPSYFLVITYSAEGTKIWKQFIIVPVAKISHPKVPNYYRPVALTSLLMKSFEELIKHELPVKTEQLLDHLQFAYRVGRGSRMLPSHFWIS